MRGKSIIVIVVTILIGQGTLTSQSEPLSASPMTVFASITSEYAQILANNFHYDAAISLMDSAILIDGNSAELYTIRGQMIMLLYEWDRAIADYNTAIEIDPTYAPAYFHRGVAYYSIAERIDREAALADFEQYLYLAPDGELAEQAQSYITGLQFEIEALGE